jgi:copper oxidase (laccase) domain-containing protein
MLQHPEVTRAIPIFDGEVLVVGYGIQRQDPTFNWSLKGLREGNGALIDALQSVLAQHNIERLYAPSPAHFNSLIAHNIEFYGKNSHPLNNAGPRVMRGVDADGVLLPSNIDKNARVAFGMSAADCAMVIVKDGEDIYAAHAGRKSLIDENFIREAPPETYKECSSVVDGIMREVSTKNHPKLKVWIGFAISAGPHFAHHVDDPQYGDFNGKMIRHIADFYGKKANNFGDEFWKSGQISLAGLIQQQFEAHGVRKTQITVDHRCTYRETDERGHHMWFSERRTHGMRNLVLAIRQK